MEWPGEQLVMKMWESLVDKGIGGLLGPWQARREGIAAADVKRHTMLIMAEAERQAESLRNGNALLLSGPNNTVCVRQEPVLGLPGEYHPAAHYAATQAVRESLRQEIAVAHAVAAAESELLNTAAIREPGVPGDDWILRWRENAARVSSSEAHELWGRVLAGEVVAPGSFSLRTLDFLRNLSKDEAQLIESLSPFAFDTLIVPANKGEQIGLPLLSDFLRLQSLGIVAGVEGMGLTVTFRSNLPNTFIRVLRCNRRCLVVQDLDPAKQFTIRQYSLSAGTEVVQLSRQPADEPNLLRVGLLIKAQGFTVAIASWKEQPNGGLAWFDGVVI